MSPAKRASTRGADLRLVEEIQTRLTAAGDPERAAKMQAYMKSEMPFYGVPAPTQKTIFKEAFRSHPLETEVRWKATILHLWRGASHREERYAAIGLSGFRSYREMQTFDVMPVYEEMVVTGAWWDYVDAVAIHRIGEFLLRDFPKGMGPLLRMWSNDEDMWRRRSAIISQVALKDETDLDLLYTCIEPNLDDKAFFIRKAIGWALRAYAWIDAAEIRRYVSTNASRLSPLSRKEALKNVGSTG